MTAWRRASERRWTCRKLTNVRAAASSSVNVASATTAAGQLAERRDHEHDHRCQRRQHRDRQDRPRAAGCDRTRPLGPPDRERDARDPDHPQTLSMLRHRVGAGAHAQGVDDVGRAEDGEAAGEPAATAIRRARRARRARRRSSRRGAGPRPCRPRRPAPRRARPARPESTGLSTAASAVAAPAAPSAAVEPQRARERPVVAADEADDGGGDGDVEAEVRDVGGGGDGRVGLELHPGREDHVAGRLRQHREPEPAPPRPGADRRRSRERSTPPSGPASRGWRSGRTGRVVGPAGRGAAWKPATSTTFPTSRAIAPPCATWSPPGSPHDCEASFEHRRLADAAVARRC